MQELRTDKFLCVWLSKFCVAHPNGRQTARFTACVVVFKLLSCRKEGRGAIMSTISTFITIVAIIIATTINTIQYSRRQEVLGFLHRGIHSTCHPAIYLTVLCSGSRAYRSTFRLFILISAMVVKVTASLLHQLRELDPLGRTVAENVILIN